MKHYYKDILIHGAQILRYLKGQHESDDLVAKLPLAVARSAARTLSNHRRVEQSEEDDDLEEFLASLGGIDESGGDGNEFGGGYFDFLSAFGGLSGGEDEFGLGGGLDFFSAFGFGGEDGQDGLGGFGDDPVLSGIMENLDKCGIDIQEMMSKVFAAVLMSGAGLDLTSPESFQIGPSILFALKDDDELDCDVADTAEILIASEVFLQCSEINKFFGSGDFQDSESLALMQSIEDTCKPVFDTVMNNASAEDVEVLMEDFLDEDSELGRSAKRCLQTLLGDNPMGNTIRFQYNHLDTLFGCVSKFGDSLPHCVLSSPPSDEGTVISMPLSLEKKLDCVIGASYEGVLEEMCMSILGALDDCLPSCDETVDDEVVSTYSSCAQEEGMGVLGGQSDLFLGMDTSVIDNNQMPEFCFKIFKKKGVGTEDIQSRLDHYNLGRSYGWTLDSIATDAKVEVKTPESPDEDKEFFISMESSTLPQGIYKSNPEDISQVESMEWSDGEAELSETESASARSSFFVFMMAGVVVIALTALALIIKYTRDRVGGQQKYQLPSDLALKIDGHHDIA